VRRPTAFLIYERLLIAMEFSASAPSSPGGKAGMTRAKAQGNHVGRPRIPEQKEAAIRRDLLAGRSVRGIIKAHGVGSKTVQRIKAELADQASAS
jgi:DNA invertase Pin-like site-specific DNA recombinase